MFWHVLLEIDFITTTFMGKSWKKKIKKNKTGKPPTLWNKGISEQWVKWWNEIRKCYKCQQE